MSRRVENLDHDSHRSVPLTVRSSIFELITVEAQLNFYCKLLNFLAIIKSLFRYSQLGL